MITARHPRRWLVLIVLCLSTLVLMLDIGVLNVAIRVLSPQCALYKRSCLIAKELHLPSRKPNSSRAGVAERRLGDPVAEVGGEPGDRMPVG
ncbi:hypothetical protein OG474_38370 [Kribbella sp. NBC_01505]|uniref:hypothetical protein n=1 Tax=Kribbella sp. NBC_01505 TaxID=2903580 RepID=UPI00386E8A24